MLQNNSLTEHQKFLKEIKSINRYYKPYFVSHYYQITKEKLTSSLDMVKYSGDKINFAIILSKKEKWNIFLQFSSLCQKKKSFFYSVIAIIISGVIGSMIFGLCADIYGRKKIIQILLFLVSLSFLIFSILSLEIKLKYNYYTKEYESNNSYFNQTYFDILSTIYSQQKTSQYFEQNFLKFIIVLILLCLALRPLGKICLALLLENSLSELNVLEIFRDYTFVSTGLPPIFTFLILIVVNNFVITLMIINLSFIILFICSFFMISESMRYHYEYCQWKELTKEITTLFNVKDDEMSGNYKNTIEFETFLFEENRLFMGNLINKINSIYDLVKHRIISLNRDIRRNSSFIIKKAEVKFNPLIIYSSISANRVFNKLKALMSIILIIIYVQVFFFEKGIVDLPFFSTKDLYIDIHNNYIINSYYFILALITLASNYIFQWCYRISLFKMTFYSSLIFVTILFILYHFIAIYERDFPLDINQTNFNMLDIHHKKNRVHNSSTHLLFIHFFLNGINFYINLLVIKLTKTLYRCTLFGIDTCLSLLAFACGEVIDYQIDNYYFLIGSLNLICIISELFFG